MRRFRRRTGPLRHAHQIPAVPPRLCCDRITHLVTRPNAVSHPPGERGRVMQNTINARPDGARDARCYPLRSRSSCRPGAKVVRRGADRWRCHRPHSGSSTGSPPRRLATTSGSTMRSPARPSSSSRCGFVAGAVTRAITLIALCARLVAQHRCLRSTSQACSSRPASLVSPVALLEWQRRAPSETCAKAHFGLDVAGARLAHARVAALQRLSRPELAPGCLLPLEQRGRS